MLDSALSPRELETKFTELSKRPGQACLILDDLHHLSEETGRHLAEWVSDQASRHREASPSVQGRKHVLLAVRSDALLCPARPEEGSWESYLSAFPLVEHIVLQSLRLPETHQLLLEALGVEARREVSTELEQWAEWLQERSGGNPFLALQLVRSAEEHGRLKPGLRQSPFVFPDGVMAQRFALLFAQHPHSRHMAGALHLVGKPLPSNVLKHVGTLFPAPSALDPASTLKAWVDAGLWRELPDKVQVDWTHDLLREEPLNWLSATEQAELAQELARHMQSADPGTRAPLVLSAWRHATGPHRPRLEKDLLHELLAWDAQEDPTGLEAFCFQLVEMKDLPWFCREEALRLLCAREARQRHRQRWLTLLQTLEWSQLAQPERRHLVDSVAASLDHGNAMGEGLMWLERLDPVLEPELRASLRLDLALNRLLKNDRRGAAPYVDGETLRRWTRDPLRLAQLELLERFLDTDVVGNPALWLSRLEEFHQAHGHHLDAWSLDRLLLQIVDAASRARDGKAVDRWQERAIASVREVARHDPPALGRARVARRLMFFGRSHEGIPDLLAAADWYLARGNLRMALPDLDAAATTHYRHGEVAEALELLKGVESLVLGVSPDFTLAAFRINACAPFLAGGDWVSASKWLEGLDEAIERHPALAPFWDYARLQVMERVGRLRPLSPEEDARFTTWVARQKAQSPPGGQRLGELHALEWVQAARAGRKGPEPHEVHSVLALLEGHNMFPRPDALAQLAEATRRFSMGAGPEWNQLADALQEALANTDLGPCVVLGSLQLARLAHLQGDRVGMREHVLCSVLEAWSSRTPAWQEHAMACFPKVRLDGLVADQSRDRMSARSRLAWLELLAQQTRPGPRFRAFGIDLSTQDPRRLLQLQLDRIEKELPRWRKDAQPAELILLDTLEQHALILSRQLPDLPDPRGGDQAPVGLVMHLSGTLRLWLCGKELPAERLGGGLFRELLVFLVVERWRHPGRPWSPRDLVRRLWGRAGDTTRQLNSLYVYISQLKSLLRQTGFPDCLERSDGGYCLHRDCPVTLDLQAFQIALEQEGMGQGDLKDKKARDRLVRVARACPHVLDPGLHGHWLDELRAWHEQRWFTLVDRLLESGNKVSERKKLQSLRQDFYPD